MAAWFSPPGTMVSAAVSTAAPSRLTFSATRQPALDVRFLGRLLVGRRLLVRRLLGGRLLLRGRLLGSRPVVGRRRIFGRPGLLLLARDLLGLGRKRPRRAGN